VTFQIIPALDLTGGRLGRLTPSGPVPLEDFGGDPLVAAAAFAAAGVPRIHVVDMDLAFRGVAANLSVIGSIVALGVPVQAAGAAASDSEIQTLLDTGADRAVMGSAGLEDRERVTGLFERLGARLVVGVETDGDRIRARGRRSVDLPLESTLDWLVAIGIPRFVVTSVPRVGSLAGPDLASLRAVVVRGGRAVSAGGIATPAHVRAVRAAGAEGAIVGRAALEGLDLAALLVEPPGT
jgi:phosphoribosylformimino-5-aminoimidazole carboxamide ribotide isomerase